MNPVRHKGCGSIVGWYVPEVPALGRIIYASDYIRFDGGHPKTYEQVREQCNKCGSIITDFKELICDESMPNVTRHQ